MFLNKWGARLVLGALMIAGALACRTTDAFVAQAPLTPTRTPRATFTPLPKITDTPVPLPTNPPPPTIAVAAATAKPPTAKPPTAKPVVKPPPTAVPVPVVAPPTAVPPPPAQRFDYAANPASCEHAGNQYIKGKVYDGSSPDSGGVPGLKMALGGGDGNNAWVTTNNEDDGVYTFTISAPYGALQPAGKYYIWILNGSGQRISDVGGPININPVGPEAAGTCWAGHVDFWRR